MVAFREDGYRLLEALVKYGVSSIFSTDAGSQYTSDEFTGMIESHGIQISMDDIGECKDNIYVERTWRTLKYEWVFLRDYKTDGSLERGLGEFVDFFNSRRLYQSLDCMAPDEVYAMGTFSVLEKDIKVA